MSLCQSNYGEKNGEIKAEITWLFLLHFTQANDFSFFLVIICYNDRAENV